MSERDLGSAEAGMKRCPYCYEQIHADAVKCRYCKSALGSACPRLAWHREQPGKMFLGVCSRIALNYGFPVTLVRLGFVLLALFHGVGILLYLVLAVAMPAHSDEKGSLSRVVAALRRSFEAVRKVLREEFPDGTGAASSGGANPAAGEKLPATETR